MSTIDLASARARLQRRRREILEASRRMVGAIDELRAAERDPEVEEASSSERAQHDLSRLAELEQRELAQIDAALARLEAGAYGLCRGCGEAIAPDRLDALPFVLECAACASDREEAEALEREARRPRRPLTPA